MSSPDLVSLLEVPFEDTVLLRFPSLAAIPGFVHAITTRPWNMAPHRGPEADRAVDRRRRICEHLGLPFERLTAPEQIHSGHVIRIVAADLGAGRMGRADSIRHVDGLVCDLPNVPIIQLSADCPLIVAVDPVRRVFGTAHASWRGTVARIAEQLVAQLRIEFGVSPSELYCAICPCAGPRRYEIGPDVQRIAESMLDGADRFFPRGDSGKSCFDLRAANVDQLVSIGIAADRIAVADVCTMTDPRFYSHRRDGADTGRFALVAGFRGD